ncbi:hypothetical protein BAE44_0015356, partial [Dichanthelium oligosanthes]
LALWTRFAQLVDLTIWKCDALVNWPENVFQALVSLRKLRIIKCSQLTGHIQASDEQSAPAPERGGLLPCLDCSDNVRSIVFGQQGDTRLVSGEGVVLPDTSSLISGSSSEVANLPPSIRDLDIYCCDNLQSVSGQLDAVQKLTIDSCNRLESLKSCLGELWSLEQLMLYHCKGLVSLPDGPQAYSSLRVLRIKNCDGIKMLPRSQWSLEQLMLFYCKGLVSLPDGPQAYSSLRDLQIKNCDGIKTLPRSLHSRLDCLEEKYLDAHYEGNLQFLCFFYQNDQKLNWCCPKCNSSHLNIFLVIARCGMIR